MWEKLKIDILKNLPSLQGNYINVCVCACVNIDLCEYVQF